MIRWQVLAEPERQQIACMEECVLTPVTRSQTLAAAQEGTSCARISATNLPLTTSVAEHVCIDLHWYLSFAHLLQIMQVPSPPHKLYLAL